MKMNRVTAGFLCFLGFLSQFKSHQDEARQSDAPKSIKRSVASKNQCMVQRVVSMEKIKLDLLKFRQEHKTKPVQKLWRGLELSRLPTFDAAFLEAADAYMTIPEDYNFSQCSSADCILAGAYQGISEDAPLRILHFFGKTGYVIATSSTVPKYSKLPNPLKDFLFTDGELKSFNVLAELLGPRQLKMISLTSIHKMPTHPDFWEAGSYHPGAVGRSVQGDGTTTYRMKPSPLILSASQLVTSKDFNFKTELFFLLTYHEMTHAFDHVIDETEKNYLKFYSGKAPWKSLSNWDLMAQNTSAAQDARYFADLKASGFLNSNSSLDTREDFAESLSLYRLKGESFFNGSELLKKKFEFIQKNIFGGRSFLAEDLRAEYKKKTINIVKVMLPKIVRGCSNASCIDDEIGKAVVSARDYLMSEEIDACTVMSENDDVQKIIQEVTEALSEDLKKFT